VNFRHLLEAHGLTKAVFEAAAGHLEAGDALLRGGTIVDATLIAASRSTKKCGGPARSRADNGRLRSMWSDREAHELDIAGFNQGTPSLISPP
jgi:hypothetical protein